MVAYEEWIFKHNNCKFVPHIRWSKEDKISNVFTTTKTNAAKLSLKRKKSIFNPNHILKIKLNISFQTRARHESVHPSGVRRHRQALQGGIPEGRKDRRGAQVQHPHPLRGFYLYISKRLVFLIIDWNQVSHYFKVQVKRI